MNPAFRALVDARMSCVRSLLKVPWLHPAFDQDAGMLGAADLAMLRIRPT